MRRLAKLVSGVAIGLALAWSVLWVALAETARHQAEAWFEAQALSGRMAGHEGVAVSGFPLRWTMAVAAPYLANPFVGQSWAAPFARIEARLMPGLHLSTELAERHTLLLAGHEVVELTGQAMQGALRLEGPALALATATASGQHMRVEARSGWAARLGMLNLRLSPAPDSGAEAVRLSAQIGALVPDAAALATLGWGASPEAAVAAQTPAIDAGALAARLVFDQPLDRHLAAPPLLTEVEIEALTLDWGAASLEGHGTFRVTATGQPEGILDLRLSNWRKILEAVVAFGLLHPDAAVTWDTMLSGFEEPSDNGQGILPVRLTFQNGRTRLGPLPLGPAPVIWPR